MRMLTRTFVLALAALVVAPGGVRAQSSAAAKAEQCLKDKLNAIGKASQCHIAAEARFLASARKEEDQSRRADSIEQCQRKLVDGYATAARRSGSACDSPGTMMVGFSVSERAPVEGVGEKAPLANEALTPDVAPSYASCTGTQVSSCSGIVNPSSATCGSHYIYANGGKVTTTTTTSCVNRLFLPCDAGSFGCTCTSTSYTNGPMACSWNGTACSNGGGYCTVP